MSASIHADQNITLIQKWNWFWTSLGDLTLVSLQLPMNKHRALFSDFVVYLFDICPYHTKKLILYPSKTSKKNLSGFLTFSRDTEIERCRKKRLILYCFWCLFSVNNESFYAMRSSTLFPIPQAENVKCKFVDFSMW